MLQDQYTTLLLYQQDPAFSCSGPCIGSKEHRWVATMDALQHDVLARIAELADPASLRSLRLVSRELRGAVEDAAVELRPSKALTDPHLHSLSACFPQATSLDISGCLALTPACFQSLGGAFLALVHLQIAQCPWLASTAPLPLPPRLQTLTLQQCTNLSSLPRAISSLQSLNRLDLTSCTSLRAIPEGLSTLTSLRILLLGGCVHLRALPEGIGALTRLERLVLSGCLSLAVLPEGFSSLRGLQILDLASCSGLAALPVRLSGLSNLLSVDLRGCAALAALPEALYGLPELRSIALGTRGAAPPLADDVTGLRVNIHCLQGTGLLG